MNTVQTKQLIYGQSNARGTRWIGGVCLLLCWGISLGWAADLKGSNTAASVISAPVAPANPEERVLRDPFLPLAAQSKAGAVPSTAAASVATGTGQKEVPVDPRALIRSVIHVQGFLKKGEQRYVMINGRMAGKGDVLQVQVSGITYRFLVKDVTADSVAIDPLP